MLFMKMITAIDKWWIQSRMLTEQHVLHYRLNHPKGLWTLGV